MNDEEKGMMSNVTIQYENIPLSNDDSTNTSPTSFIVEGFKEVSNTSTTEQIISTLNTILNQVINVTGYSDVTAADALTNPTSLESSIRTALNTEITNSKETFNFNDQFTSIQDIVNALVINLPSSITLTNDKQAQIPDVIITYNGIQLSNEQDTTSFIVEGFEQTTIDSIGSTGSPTSRNQQIASLLDSLLNPIIQIEAYSKIIASDSISNANNQSLLTSSIETSLANEISN
ncbi:hypothetical protein J6W34_00715 [bacterium]|nr:hypothetical protein [bacterium]